jgi:hypothetical protein
MDLCKDLYRQLQIGFRLQSIQLVRLFRQIFHHRCPNMATDTQMTGTDDDRIRLPGFGLDVDYLPDWTRQDEEWKRFPHAIADALASNGVTIRERRMLEFINQITDVRVIRGEF